MVESTPLERNEEQQQQQPVHYRSKMVPTMIKIGISLVGIYLLVSLIIPIVLLVYPAIVNKIVFANILTTRANFSHPETLDLERVHNFYLNVESNVRIGVWHFRSPLIEDQSFTDEDDYFRKHIASTPINISIVLYMHGNAFDRALFTRRNLCKKLRDELKYHVIAFDYRGYGDSTGQPTEAGLVKDARFIYDWLHAFNDGQRKIYLWGHSLGTAVACQLAARLSDDESKSLAGIVMEAPFMNVHQALQTHWMALLFRWQPWFYGLTARALQKQKLGFETRGHMSSVNCPCVLLHADDDLTVPYIHSRHLFQAGMTARDDHRQKKILLKFKIDMISYHRSGYGHRLIYQAPKLVPALKRVMFEEHL